MPLPLFLIAGAAIAGAAGVGATIHGGKKGYDAQNKLKEAKQRHSANLDRLEGVHKLATTKMDELGCNEIEILASFETYSQYIARIQNRPYFKEIERMDKLPEFKLDEIKEVSIGASILMGGLGGATLGTLGGFAASGATTSAVMALGTASTGTAISSLSGVAATNATLAALGGGSLAVGGGGMALGAAVLGGATLGVGLLVGGIILSVTGSKLSNKADEAYNEMLEAEARINKVYPYLEQLSQIASEYNQDLLVVRRYYEAKLERMTQQIDSYRTDMVDWNILSSSEKMVIKQTTMLVGLLYAMCKVNLVTQTGEDVNKINYADIISAQAMAKTTLKDL